VEKNPLAVFVNGVEWRPFVVEFKTQEGKFNTEIFAVDLVHAIERLEELKQTAIIIGESFGCVAVNT
jgi:hypothetical protein